MVSSSSDIVSPPAPLSSMAAGIVDKDLAHLLSSNGKKMSAALPVWPGFGLSADVSIFRFCHPNRTLH
jgi:hypothetical protein